MKTKLIVFLFLVSLSVAAKQLPVQTLANVMFFKDGKNVAHEYVIQKEGEGYKLILKNQKSKVLTKEQATNIQTDINSLIWKFEYKEKKLTQPCQKNYARLTTNNTTAKVCQGEVVKEEATFALLNRLHDLIEKK